MTRIRHFALENPNALWAFPFTFGESLLQDGRVGGGSCKGRGANRRRPYKHAHVHGDDDDNLEEEARSLLALIPPSQCSAAASAEGERWRSADFNF